DAVILRNYEGMMIRYNPTGAPDEERVAVETQGVSGLLAHEAEVLVPRDNPRMARRATALVGAANGRNGNGSGHKANGNGHKANGNGHKNGNGNGKGRANGNGNGH